MAINSLVHQIPLVVYRQQRPESDQMIQEGLKALTEEEKVEYRRLIIKMLEAWGGDHASEEVMESEDPGNMGELRVDPEDFSLKPAPAPQRKPDPGPGEMRRTKY